MRNQQLIRQWKILTALSASSGMSYRQIVATLEPDDLISLRTLQRDLQALEIAGFPLENEKQGKEVHWSLRLRHGLPFPIGLAEVVGLHAAALAARVQDLPESKNLVALCSKLVPQLPSKTRAFLHAVEQAIIVLGPQRVPTDGRDGLAGRFARWAVESKTAEILYDSLRSGRREWRRVDPYAIVTTPSGNYVWGHCHRSGEFRVFHLGRVRDSRPTGDVFRKIEISPQQAFQASFEIWQGKPERVCVRFAGRAAVLAAEKTWHASQIIRKTRTGIELRLNVNPGKDLERWILGFGSDAEVIAPRSLRDRIAAELNRASENYHRLPVRKKPVTAVGRKQAGRSPVAK